MIAKKNEIEKRQRLVRTKDIGIDYSKEKEERYLVRTKKKKKKKRKERYQVNILQESLVTKTCRKTVFCDSKNYRRMVFSKSKDTEEQYLVKV